MTSAYSGDLVLLLEHVEDYAENPDLLPAQYHDLWSLSG
jgi:hypothetical protein